MVSVSFGTKNRKESPLCVLFSYLHSMSTMQPYISEPFIGDIWRIEVDELTDIVFTEVRNSADKQVSFSAINLSTGHVNFNALRLPERWLTGIEAAFDGVLLLHNYQSDAGPAHKGLIAVDAVTGETLWSNYTIGFDHVSVEGPIVYDAHIHPRKLFLADVKNGATKRIFEPSVYQELKNNIIAPELKTPEMLSVAGLPVHPYGERIHCLDYNNLRIVSLHALKAGVLTQSIFIMDGMQTVYQDILNTDI